MAPVACPNVDIDYYLTFKGPTTKRADVKWRCSDFVLKMLEEGIDADVELYTDYEDEEDEVEETVKVHRSVLTCVCPQLKDAIEISMTIEALKLFLLLLYTTNEGDDDVVPELNDAINEHFEQLYAAVANYDVEKRLGFALLPALARNLTPANCWDYFRNSLRANHLPYRIRSSEICCNYVRSNYAEVIKSSSLLEKMKNDSEKVQRITLHVESQASRPTIKSRNFNKPL